MLVSLDTLSEYAEKLLSHGVATSEVEAFLTPLAVQAQLLKKSAETALN